MIRLKERFLCSLLDSLVCMIVTIACSSSLTSLLVLLFSLIDPDYLTKGTTEETITLLTSCMSAFSFLFSLSFPYWSVAFRMNKFVLVDETGNRASFLRCLWYGFLFPILFLVDLVRSLIWEVDDYLFERFSKTKLIRIDEWQTAERPPLDGKALLRRRFFAETFLKGLDLLPGFIIFSTVGYIPGLFLLSLQINSVLPTPLVIGIPVVLNLVILIAPTLLLSKMSVGRLFVPCLLVTAEGREASFKLYVKRSALWYVLWLPELVRLVLLGREDSLVDRLSKTRLFAKGVGPL